MTMTLKLSLNEIDDSDELNCRGRINPIDVIPLVKDIKEHGLLQPIIVRTFKSEDGFQSDKKYQLVAGFRRFMAHRVMEADSIEVVIREIDFRKARFINLAENLQRKELNILQEAHAISKLEDQGYSQEKIAEELNMGRGWVQIRSMLLQLPEEIQIECAAGVITQHEIRELHTLPTKDLKLDIAKKMKEARLKGKTLKKEQIRALANHSSPHQVRHRRVRMPVEIQKLNGYFLGYNLGLLIC